MATQAATADKVKRDVGPVKVSYLAADGKEHDRVIADVKSVKVLQRSDNKAKIYGLDKVPANMVGMLVASALAKRFDISARNAVKADSKASVIDVSDGIFTNIISGKFSSRGEGKGGPGRSFDFDMWISVFHAAHDMKRKAKPSLPVWTDVQDAKMRAKLEAMDGKARNKYLNETQAKDPVLKLAKTEYTLANLRTAAKATKGGDAFADLF